MINIFDNCYLSLNSEKSTKDEIIVIDQEITSSNDIDSILHNVKQNLSNRTVQIKTNKNNFIKIYYSVYSTILNKEGVDELFKLDCAKEIILNNDYHFNELDIELIKIGTSSFNDMFSFRADLLFSNYVLGDLSVEEILINRISKLFNFKENEFYDLIANNLPAFLEDLNYNYEFISNEKCINHFLNEYKSGEISSSDLLIKIKNNFQYDRLWQYFNIMNNNKIFEKDYVKYWNIDEPTQFNFIKSIIVNTRLPVELYGLFPDVNHYDDVNPLFWNLIFKNKEDKRWLSMFKLINKS
jgi:hypothetical protein